MSSVLSAARPTGGAKQHRAHAGEFREPRRPEGRASLRGGAAGRQDRALRGEERGTAIGERGPRCHGVGASDRRGQVPRHDLRRRALLGRQWGVVADLELAQRQARRGVAEQERHARQQAQEPSGAAEQDPVPRRHVDPDQPQDTCLRGELE